MINKIIVSIIFICLLLAISIKLFNPDLIYVELSSPFISLLKSTSMDLENFKVEIPSIPSIPLMQNVEGFALILNAFITFVNGISGLVNFLITIVNVLIKVVQFVFILLNNLITFKDELVTQ